MPQKCCTEGSSKKEEELPKQYVGVYGRCREFLIQNTESRGREKWNITDGDFDSNPYKLESAILKGSNPAGFSDSKKGSSSPTTGVGIFRSTPASSPSSSQDSSSKVYVVRGRLRFPGFRPEQILNLIRRLENRPKWDSQMQKGDVKVQFNFTHEGVNQLPTGVTCDLAHLCYKGQQPIVKARDLCILRFHGPYDGPLESKTYLHYNNFLESLKTTGGKTDGNGTTESDKGRKRSQENLINRLSELDIGVTNQISGIQIQQSGLSGVSGNLDKGNSDKAATLDKAAKSSPTTQQMLQQATLNAFGTEERLIQKERERLLERKQSFHSVFSRTDSRSDSRTDCKRVSSKEILSKIPNSISNVGVPSSAASSSVVGDRKRPEKPSNSKNSSNKTAATQNPSLLEIPPLKPLMLVARSVEPEKVPVQSTHFRACLHECGYLLVPGCDVAKYDSKGYDPKRDPKKGEPARYAISSDAIKKVVTSW